MSSRVEQILEVVTEVFRECGGTSRISRSEVTDWRQRAVETVAARRGIGISTVSDKYRRQLKPDVDGTEDFDRLLTAWLQTGSSGLRDVLQRHAVEFGDERRIEDFFESSKIGSPADGEDAAAP